MLTGTERPGVLEPSDVGAIVEDEHDGCPFCVSFRGSTYWYTESSLRRVPAAVRANRFAFGLKVARVIELDT